MNEPFIFFNKIIYIYIYIYKIKNKINKPQEIQDPKLTRKVTNEHGRREKRKKKV